MEKPPSLEMKSPKNPIEEWKDFCSHEISTEFLEGLPEDPSYPNTEISHKEYDTYPIHKDTVVSPDASLRIQSQQAVIKATELFIEEISEHKRSPQNEHILSRFKKTKEKELDFLKGLFQRINACFEEEGRDGS